MSTVVTNTMLSAIDARLKRFAFETSASIPTIHDKFIKVKSTDRAYEILNRVVGVGEAQEVAENGTYGQQEIKQDISTTIQMKKFGFVINVSRELILDNMFAPIQDDVAKAMKNAMVQTKEKRAINLLNNGFSSQNAQDGEDLFSTAHILRQGGTQSNKAAVSSALDLTTLWDARNTMQTTKGNSTLYDAIYDAKYIIVPQALERRAHELIKSEWIPQSSENTANVYGSVAGRLEVLKSPFLSSTTAWFLAANPSDVMEYALVMFEREPLSIITLFNIQGNTELGISVDRDVYSWKCRERYEVGTPTWYGVYGNPGA